MCFVAHVTGQPSTPTTRSTDAATARVQPGPLQ